MAEPQRRKSGGVAFMNLRLVLTLAISSVLLAACGGGSNSPAPGSTPPPAGGNTSVITARFDPTNSVIPFPFDLLRLGSTDGTLNIPVANPANFADPAVAMNALDGFSTVAPWATKFSAAINPNTVVPGSTVRLFEVGPAGQAPAPRPLTAGVDYTAVVAPSYHADPGIAIVPLKPLKPFHTYLAVM
ncbi:MAG TPA: hypothetical protein VFY12_10095, partial [Arenimonas sp.]|nr:hypothetical protein [Arenimonas sp.]